MRRTSLGLARLLVAGACGMLIAGCAGAKERPSGPRLGASASAPTAPSASSAEAGLAPSLQSTPLPAAGTRAPFVLAIVVDQLSAWLAASRFPELPSRGGFARLRREGTWIKNLTYPYALTDTAPGHTSLHTGRVPAESGIFGNEVPDLATGARISVVRDESVQLLAAGGSRPRPGASAWRLRVETVADRLRAAHPEALVVSVSVKDRAAILSGGRRPSHVLWFEKGAQAFVTSTAFASAYPAWAVGVGDAKAVAAARARPWELTDAAWVKAHSVTPDNQPGEGDLDGLGVTFPHVVRSAAAFRASPASDVMIAALGQAAIAADYQPTRPTLLLLSMSASDLTGHVFGPDSWEAWDHLRKLDATLGALLESLDQTAGAPITVLLAGDHGNVSMPEVPAARTGVRCNDDLYDRPCSPGTRLGQTALTAELNLALRGVMGEGRWVAGLADPYVFLTPAARALPEARRARVDQTIRGVLAKHSAIAEVHDVRTLATQCPRVLARALGVPARARRGEDMLTLICRSWSEGVGAGDYFLVPRPGSFFDGELVTGKGTGHGTPYLYDRTVSMLVRGPGAIEAGAVIEDPVDFAVFAAMEAAFLGLEARPPRDILAAHRAPPAPAAPPRP